MIYSPHSLTAGMHNSPELRVVYRVIAFNCTCFTCRSLFLARCCVTTANPRRGAVRRPQYVAVVSFERSLRGFSEGGWPRGRGRRWGRNCAALSRRRPFLMPRYRKLCHSSYPFFPALTRDSSLPFQPQPCCFCPRRLSSGRPRSDELSTTWK